MRRLWVLVLAACTHAGGSGEAGFHVFFPDATARGVVLHAKKRVQVKPTATCRYADGRDAHWAITGARVESGELPPGLALEDGAITGVPTSTGQWQVRIAFAGITCAGKAQPDETVDVGIVVAK